MQGRAIPASRHTRLPKRYLRQRASHASRRAMYDTPTGPTPHRHSRSTSSKGYDYFASGPAPMSSKTHPRAASFRYLSR
eukprot:8663745-Pyramimonas_sp.AAC.2